MVDGRNQKQGADGEGEGAEEGEDELVQQDRSPANLGGAEGVGETAELVGGGQHWGTEQAPVVHPPSPDAQPKRPVFLFLRLESEQQAENNRTKNRPNKLQPPEKSQQLLLLPQQQNKTNSS